MPETNTTKSFELQGQVWGPLERKEPSHQVVPCAGSVTRRPTAVMSALSSPQVGAAAAWWSLCPCDDGEVASGELLDG